MKKLYTAKVEMEVLVLAEDEQNAKDMALEGIREQLWDSDDVHLSPARYLPDGWEPDSLIYHDGDEDIRADEALKDEEKRRANH